jgi:hypothetical protein
LIDLVLAAINKAGLGLFRRCVRSLSDLSFLLQLCIYDAFDTNFLVSSFFDPRELLTLLAALRLTPPLLVTTYLKKIKYHIFPHCYSNIAPMTYRFDMFDVCVQVPNDG